MDQGRADVGAERPTLPRALRAAWRRLSDAGVPAGAQAEDLAGPRRQTSRAVDRVDDELGSLEEVAPVDRLVSRDDDHHVRPAEEGLEVRPSAHHSGRIPERGDVRVVETDLAP